jgi:RNA polymerase sigma factor (sigma-70 family)
LKPLGVTAISTEATDEQLVALAQGGSSEAFALLFRRYRPAIARYAGRMLGDDARAEDVVQEVFLSALRSISTLDRPAGFKAWLYRIAHNTCVDQVRRSGRAEEVSMDAHGLPASEEIRLFRQAPSTFAALRQKEDFNNLREAFGGLPPSQSEVLVMRELEGLSYDQIAARMGVTRASVESMLFRARQGLRDEYGEIATGERCLRMRPVMARMAEGIGGLRDRRALARHVRGCQSCRRDALALGLGGPALEPPTRGLSRVAALLPLPWFINRRAADDPTAASSAGTGGGGSLASHAQTAITQLGSGMGLSADHAATALQKAVAVVAAVAVVGGGGYVASKSGHGGELLLKPDRNTIPTNTDVGPAVPPGLLPLASHRTPAGAGTPVVAGAPGGPGVLGGPDAAAAPLLPTPGGVPGPLDTLGVPDAMAAPIDNGTTNGDSGDAPAGGGAPDSTSGTDTTAPATGGDLGSSDTGSGSSGGSTGSGSGSGTGTGGGGSSTGGSDPTTEPDGGGVTTNPADPAPPCVLPDGLAKKDRVPPGWAKKGCVADATVAPAP